MEDPEFNKLIEKYLQGRCNAEETERVHEWYAALPQDHVPEEMQDEASRQSLKLRMLNKVRSNIDQVPVRPSFLTHYGAGILSFTGIAAALFLIAFLLFKSQSGLDSGQLSPEHAVVAVKVVENKSQSLFKKTLPDGSDIWLSPGTKIIFPEIFDANERRIEMSGEAFFMVKPNKQKPFIIQSGHMETRVWGTSFRVRDFPGIEPQVFVATGKVSVKSSSGGAAPLMLLPNQKAELETRSGSMVKTVDASPDPGMKMWRKASLTFNDAALKDVVIALNREFGSQISISDKEMAGYVLTADFNDQNLADILEMLEKSLNILYVMNGPKIELINY